MAKTSNNQEKPNKLRNQLIGFATLLIIMAIVAPWILTDKSANRISTTPILQPSIVGQQNQEIVPDDPINDLINSSTAANTPDIPYVPDNSGSVDIPEIPDVPSAPAVVKPNTSTPATPATTSVTTTTTPSTAVLDGKPFIIQLAALKNRQKIDELVALLRLNNYNVKIIPKNPEPNQLIKLQVGPYAKKEQAEQVIIDLNNLTKLKGFIVAN